MCIILITYLIATKQELKNVEHSQYTTHLLTFLIRVSGLWDVIWDVSRTYGGGKAPGSSRGGGDTV